MKNKFRILGTVLFGTMMAMALMFTSCKKDNDDPDDGKIDPGTIAKIQTDCIFRIEVERENEVGS